MKRTLRFRLPKRDRELILGGVPSPPREVMERAGFLDIIGCSNVCPHIAAVPEQAQSLATGNRARTIQLTVNSTSNDL